VKFTGRFLESEGYETVRFEFDGWTVMKLYCSIVGSAGNMHTYLKDLKGEPMNAGYDEMKSYSDISNFCRPFIDCCLQCNREERKRHMVETQRDGGLSARKYHEVIVELQEFRNQFWNRMKADKLDAIILPSTPIPAIKHGLGKTLYAAMSYMFVANLLDAPAGVVPIRTTHANDVHYPRSELPRRQWDSIHRTAHYSMIDSDQLPIGIQVLTKPFEDETCLRIMKELQEHFKFKIPVKVELTTTKKPPSPPNDSSQDS
jgi:fatty acid amide hydrolase